MCRQVFHANIEPSFVSYLLTHAFQVHSRPSPKDPSDGKRRPLCVAQAFRLSFALEPKLCILGLGNPGDRVVPLADVRWYGAGLGIWLRRQPRSKVPKVGR
jgi:hypothetical protein